MKTTIASSCAQISNAWMGIFFTKSSFLFFMEWNSINVSYLGMSLAPQANTLFDKLHIPSFASR
jgi:hypothetical protein